VKEIFVFSGGNNGFLPLSGGGALVGDAAGNLYGTALSGTGASGIVFELSPQLGSSVWSETVLFAEDNASLFAPMVFDHSGNLYTTSAPFSGLGSGSAFELSPPASPGQPWTQTILYTFTSSKAQSGYNPYGGLVFDKAGNLYGTTAAGGTSNQCGKTRCGTVFELSTLGGNMWSQSTLHSFKGQPTDGIAPETTLMIDPAGHLYGVTFSGGAFGTGGSAFEVIPH
jgi:hypothetical protein